MISLATWNVNSIKARHDRFFDWLDRTDVDIVCIQELKVTEEDFPWEAVKEAGYEAAVHPQKTWNGVAILSRHPIENVIRGMEDDVDDGQARLVTAQTAGLHVCCGYFPNGRNVGSDAWEYKLAWMARLRTFLDRFFDASDELVVCGDVNVAPEDRDVAKPEKWAPSVLCHELGREALERLLEFGLEDVLRKHHDGPGPYTWWDYRRLAFPKGDGLRIDHIFATPSLADRCVEAHVDRDERKGNKPSDHAPVIASFE